MTLQEACNLLVTDSDVTVLLHQIDLRTGTLMPPWVVQEWESSPSCLCANLLLSGSTSVATVRRFRAVLVKLLEVVQGIDASPQEEFIRRVQANHANPN